MKKRARTRVELVPRPPEGRILPLNHRACAASTPPLLYFLTTHHTNTNTTSTIHPSLSSSSSSSSPSAPGWTHPSCPGCTRISIFAALKPASHTASRAATGGALASRAMKIKSSVAGGRGRLSLSSSPSTDETAVSKSSEPHHGLDGEVDQPNPVADHQHQHRHVVALHGRTLNSPSPWRSLSSLKMWMDSARRPRVR